MVGDRKSLTDAYLIMLVISRTVNHFREIRFDFILAKYNTCTTPTASCQSIMKISCGSLIL
jgi:hypothetical protein